MFKEMLSIKGLVSIRLTDKEGNLKTLIHQNLVVNSGLALIISRLMGNTKGAISHMAVGTGATAASAGQTALFTEKNRLALDSQTAVTTNVTGDSVQYVTTFPAGAASSGALTEAGLFNAEVAGDMLARVMFPVVNKGVDDVMVITWKITVS